MNADRHALDAALEYAEKQSQEINILQGQMQYIQDENRDLRNRLRDCRGALDRDSNLACEAKRSSPKDIHND